MASTNPSAGALRESIRFERQSQVSDGMGGSSGSWSPVVTGVAARITPLRGAEQLIAQGLQATRTYEVWVRYCADALSITEADRIVDERTGRTLNIRDISNPDEKHRFVRFIAESGVAS